MATAAPALPIGLLTLVTLVSASKEPVADEMNPVGACAEISLVLPTTSGKGPCRGVIGMFGAVMHGTSFHSRFGNVAVKHPSFLGSGFCDMYLRHSSARLVSWLVSRCSAPDAAFDDFVDGAGSAALTVADTRIERRPIAMALANHVDDVSSARSRDFMSIPHESMVTDWRGCSPSAGTCTRLGATAQANGAVNIPVRKCPRLVGA